jgi:hypothetical protein
MPNEIDALFAQVAEKPKKETYQPAKGEEAIFAAPKKGLLDYLAPLLPFYSQFTGQTPWQSPETAMEAIGWGMGGLMRGGGMAKTAAPKGASSISKALEEIGAVFGKRGGLPTGPVERGWTRQGEVSPISEGIKQLKTGTGAQQLARGSIEAPASSLAEQKLIETTAQKQLPQYAGPTAPRGIPQPYAPQSWRERTFPGTIQRAQDVIEDLFRESLRAKGMIE